MVDIGDCWFILGQGHSGTHFLQKILDDHVEEDVKHQPPTPLHDVVYAIYDGDSADDKSPLSEQELVRRIRNNHKPNKYIVDPPFTEFWYRAFPKANYGWLHRNGIDTVRGFLTHHVYDDRNIGGEKWGVFETGCQRWGRVCNQVKDIEQTGRDILHFPFEDLIEGKCVEQVNEVTGSNIDSYDTSPENQTPDKRKEEIIMPENWSQYRWNYFWDVCGESMEYLGYDDDERIPEHVK